MTKTMINLCNVLKIKKLWKNNMEIPIDLGFSQIAENEEIIILIYYNSEL